MTTTPTYRIAPSILAADFARLAFNPATPLDGLEWVRDKLERVLIMSANPGVGVKAA